jgi:hypothetical protein
MGRLETKVGQLDSLHKRHLARPSFDDAGTEETEIKTLTREISEVRRTTDFITSEKGKFKTCKYVVMNESRLENS